MSDDDRELFVPHIGKLDVHAMARDLFPAAIAAAESRGYAKAIAKLRARAVDIAAYDDAYMHAADYLEASSPTTEEPNHG